MELVNYLKQKYDLNTPIFINDIEIDGVSSDNIRQCFSRLVKNKLIKRYVNGIYYFPKKTIIGESTLSFEDVIFRKYINADSKIIGYYTGLSFLNKLGMTTQVPNVIEVTTNIEKSKKRDINIKDRKIILRRGKVLINNDNYKILQFLDIFNQVELYQVKENYDLLKCYILNNKFKKDDLQELLPKYSKKTINLIVESGLIYEFAS